MSVGLMAHCVTTTQMAGRLGLSAEVCDPLRQVFTRWGGRGVPDGIGGEQIARQVRLFHLVADAIEVGIARFAEHGVGVETCLLGLDGSDDVAAVVVAGLRARPWECVVIGGGVRNEDQLGLFEQVLNLVRRYAPDAAIAFNSTPADTFDAAARWVDVPGPAGAS
jgi:hypothetical protein